jgi:hypothetical protein
MPPIPLVIQLALIFLLFVVARALVLWVRRRIALKRWAAAPQRDVSGLANAAKLPSSARL